jgi:hypothetical protein
MKRSFLSSFLALASPAFADEVYTAPFGPGGTWNLYQYVRDNVTWEQARLSAEATSPSVGYQSLRGHLVSFSSMGENLFAAWLVNGMSGWSSLTDNERFGGREAGSHPINGWAQTTGEPLTFTRWKANEPDNWPSDGPGEDAVSIDRKGHWSDAACGFEGQGQTRQYYIIEWESQSAVPPAGAIAVSKIWPEDLKMPAPIAGKWNGRWVSGSVRRGASNYRSPRSLREGTALLADGFNEQTAIVFQSGQCLGETPWLWLATQDTARQGWLPGLGTETENFPGLPTNSPYIGAVAGKIHVAEAGTYTFAITAEDAFALRIGGQRWKSVSGDGYIDPLDPLTVTQPNGDNSSKALAVMDLPAGDHLVEAIWMVATTGSEFHVLSAPGSHNTEGSTTDWRPLGHKVSNEGVPTLGISDAGWTLECSQGKKPDGPEISAYTLQDGLLKLELDLNREVQTGLPVVNFSDAPSTNTTHFPGALTFPNDRPGMKDDDWPCRARARLIVPQSGLYQIGVHASGMASLQIKGGTLHRFSQTAQGSKGLSRQEDSFEFNGQVNTDFEPKIISEWKLEKGEYDIEVFYVKHIGPASFAIFSCPAGPYGPGLLTSGGAGIRPDVPGLPHATR